ncbi:uncharacterized protein LOC144681301 isoform X1 [Cetorhinus maximus]
MSSKNLSLVPFYFSSICYPSAASPENRVCFHMYTDDTRLYFTTTCLISKILKVAPSSSVRSSMQSDSDPQEIVLHVVGSINDLHRTNSSLEVTKSYSGQTSSRPSTILIAQETSANGLVTASLLEERERDPAFSHLADSVRESRDQCECSCVCCQSTSCDKVFYAVLITLVLVSIAIGMFTVYYTEKMNKELAEISHQLDSLDQSVRQVKFTNYLLRNPMNVTESMDAARIHGLHFEESTTPLKT